MSQSYQIKRSLNNANLHMFKSESHCIIFPEINFHLLLSTLSIKTMLFYFVGAIFVLISRLVKAAEEYHLPKALKESKGGGLKEFSIQEMQCFDGCENEQSFFTTQDRQWLVLRLLESIRAKTTDSTSIPGMNLLIGQPISKTRETYDNRLRF